MSTTPTQANKLMTGHGLPAHYRLKSRADFQQVFATRQSAADGVLRIHACASKTCHPRLGLSVSRRLGGAVERNRYKRLLREAFRLSFAELPDLDLVVIPQGRRTAELAQFQASLVALANRLDKRLTRLPP
jgi:ribonuclease P protein component